MLYVQAEGADGWVGQVHDLVCSLVELAGGGAQGEGLAHPDLAGDNAQERFGDAKADMRDRFLVAGPLAHLGGRDALAEGHLAEAEVDDPRRACRRGWCSSAWSASVLSLGTSRGRRWVALSRRGALRVLSLGPTVPSAGTL